MVEYHALRENNLTEFDETGQDVSNIDMSDFRRNQVKPRNPWTITQPQMRKPENINIQNNVKKNSGNKFTEATKAYQAAAQKYALDYDSSSEEDELESGNIISILIL